MANWACNMRCILSGFFCAIFIIICCFFSGKDLNNFSCSSFKNTKLSNHEFSDLGGDIDGDLGGDPGGDIGGVLGGDIGGDFGNDLVLEEEDQFGLRPSNEIGLCFIGGCFFSSSIRASYSSTFFLD